MPFYVGDWRKCPEVRALSLSARALWFEMLCLMWESGRRGYLEISGKPITNEVLARMVGESADNVTILLEEIEKNNVFSREKNTEIIFNRRMIFDESIRLKRSKSGTKGMKIRYNKTLNKTLTNADNEYDNEYDNDNAINSGKLINSIPPLFEFWISLENLTQHKTATESMRAAEARVLKEYPIENIKACISIYNQIMGNKPDTYLGQYPHTFDDFFRKGSPQKVSPFQKFLPENKPLERLKRKESEYI